MRKTAWLINMLNEVKVLILIQFSFIAIAHHTIESPLFVFIFGVPILEINISSERIIVVKCDLYFCTKLVGFET